MYAQFKPINDNVLVKIDIPEEKTKGGIILPNESQEKTQHATIIEMSEKLVYSEACFLNIGDKIYFKKYTGTALDESYLVLREEDILGVLHV